MEQLVQASRHVLRHSDPPWLRQFSGQYQGNRPWNPEQTASDSQPLHVSDYALLVQLGCQILERSTRNSRRCIGKSAAGARWAVVVS